MNAISTVKTVHAYLFPSLSPLPLPPHLFVVSTGEVPTSGWTCPRLVPRVYVTEPADGVWDLDFVADAPNGIVLNVICPVCATYVGSVPDWAKVVRVHGTNNEVDCTLITKTPVVQVNSIRAPKAGRAIVTRTIARYEDSHQPTGTIVWINDGPFGTPTPHAEMKKLEHRLTLIVDAPNEDQINTCINAALTSGVVAGLVAGFASGGLAAVQAAAAAVVTSIQVCLGTAAVQFVDDSHWVYWTT